MPNQPEQPNSEHLSWLDNLIVDYGLVVHRLEKTLPEFKAAVEAHVQAAVAEALENALTHSETAWVQRGEFQSHEEFVHTNLLRDMLATLRTGKPQEEKSE